MTEAATLPPAGSPAGEGRLEARCRACPFCAAMPIVEHFDYPGRSREHFVQCYAGPCQARGPLRGDVESAIAAWNRRMP